MPLRLMRLLVMSALFLSFGVHLPVLQGVAWARMWFAFSQNDSVSVAAAKTFDGRHPCAMCLKVKKVAAESNSLAAVRPAPSPDMALVAAPTLPTAWHAMLLARRDVQPYTFSSLAFPAPPPKSSLA